MYETAVGTWRTPGGACATFEYRQGTIDWNVITATLTADEYHLADLSLRGWAFDLGAYVGSVAVALALDHPGLRVLALEPVPDNSALCQANVRRNGLQERVTVVDGAIGPPGHAKVGICYGFRGSELLELHSFVGNESRFGHSEGPHQYRETDNYSLSRLVGIAGEVPSFVKTDCEGGEWHMLADPIMARLPRIHGEWHPTDGRARGEFEALLAATHALSFTGPQAGPGGFVAVLR